MGRPLVRTSTRNRAKACSRRTLLASMGIAAIHRKDLWFFVSAIPSSSELRHGELEIGGAAHFKQVCVIIGQDDAVGRPTGQTPLEHIQVEEERLDLTCRRNVAFVNATKDLKQINRNLQGCRLIEGAIVDAVGKVLDKLPLLADVLNNNLEIRGRKSIEGFGLAPARSSRTQTELLAPDGLVVNPLRFADRERQHVTEFAVGIGFRADELREAIKLTIREQFRGNR